MARERWEPDDPAFWEKTGKRVARRALALTTFSLTLSFATWFIWSAAVLYLNNIGFHLDLSQRFWLAATPGLSGATWRIVHSFLILRFGTRTVVTVSTLTLLAPAIGLGVAVQNPSTPFSVLIALSALAGFGGGNFSSFMPSTSLHFPKTKQGTALGIQAGIGNFGVSIAQFIVPVVIAAPLFGALGGTSQSWTEGGTVHTVWLQNAGFVWVVPIIVSGVLNAWYLRDLPVRRSLRGQLVVFRRKHMWVMLLLYFMTFGTFSGFAASFPLLIKEIFGGFPNAPVPLAFAFLGPLIGSMTRPPGGWLSDRFGGGAITLVCGILLCIGAVGVTFTTAPASAADFPPFLALILLIFLAAGIGNGSTFQQIPFIFPPEEAGPVLGFTAAIAAYGAFFFPVLFGWALKTTGSPNAVFLGFLVFSALCTFLNWWYYTRTGCEKPCKPARKPAPAT